MRPFVLLVVVCMGAVTIAQENRRTTTTPVPILKQINKVNEDGSYTYGYENADGSYKIETRDLDGQVHGKYGFYDDAGTLREIEYGASKAGFYPQGTDVKLPEVAPPRNDIEAPQDGSYDPELFTYPYQHNYQGRTQSSPARRIRPKGGRRVQGGRNLNLFQQQQQQQPQQQQQQPQQYFRTASAPATPTQPQYQPQPQPQYYQQQQQHHRFFNQHQQQLQAQAPVFNAAQLFQGHPARNVDLNTGSYSVTYTG